MNAFGKTLWKNALAQEGYGPGRPGGIGKTGTFKCSGGLTPTQGQGAEKGLLSICILSPF